MFQFLPLYIIFILPLINFKFERKLIYISTLLFIFFIAILRDPSASDDYINYYRAVDGKAEYFKSLSPTFGLLINFLKDFLKLNSSLSLQIISLVPIICIFWSAIILNCPILIAIFLSSEAFVLLSFNAIRQGLSIGFLVLATAILIREIFEKKRPSNYSYIKFFISLILSLMAHPAAILFIGINLMTKLFLIVKDIFITLKIKKYTYPIIIFFIISITFIFIFQQNIFSRLIERGIQSLELIDPSFITTNTSNATGNSHVNAFYRFSIMSIISIYGLVKFNSSSLLIKKKNMLLKNLLILTNLSFLPLISFFIFLPPILLSRISYFYFIPILISFYFLNKINDNRKSIIYFLICLMGLITYSSNSVVYNLIN